MYLSIFVELQTGDLEGTSKALWRLPSCNLRASFTKQIVKMLSFDKQNRLNCVVVKDMGCNLCKDNFQGMFTNATVRRL